MKKLLAMVSVAALTGLSMMAAIEWGSVDNLSRGAAVTVSSNAGAAASITDNNGGTRWQAIPSTHMLTNDWALVDLGEVKTFTDMEISFEASHAKKYSLYISETAIPYESLNGNVNTEENPLMLDYNKIDAAWLAAATPAAVGEDDTENSYTASHLFPDGISGRYILVYANELNNNGNQYGLSIFELKVANIEGREEVAALKVTGASAKPGVGAEVTVTAVNTIGDQVSLDKVTGLKLTASSSDVTISGGENGVYTVTGTTPGVYTLTATAKVGETELSANANFTVEFVWEGVENVATGKSVLGRVIPGREDPHPFTDAVDGDEATYYEYNGEWAGGNTWLLIDLGSEYLVEAIGASYGDKSGGIVKFGYALDNTGIMNFVGNNSQWVWDNDNVPEGWSFKAATRGSNAITTVTYATPVKARYIAVRDADNPNGKPQLREVYVKGEQIQPSVASDMEITFEKGGLFVGETTNVGLTILDQYGNPFGTADDAVITVEGGATYADGVITATAKGVVTVTATVGETTKTANIVVADQADYCMTGATVTSDESKSPAVAATDGGADPAAHGALYVVTENESQGEHTHWILADLHKPYDLDMIIAIWEGACPADYDVYVGETEDNFVKLYSVTGHNQATWYDRFSGKEMKNVQFIKLVTTKNATGYGIKLFDLKAYGKSNTVSQATEVKVEAAGDYIATDEEIQISASVLDQFGATMTDQPIEYSCKPATAAVVNGMFKAEVPGIYEITATSGQLTGSAMINVVANASDKITTKMVVTLNDTEIEQNPFAGNEIQMPELPSTLVIALDKVYDFDLIKLRWEAACPSDYTVKATYADGSEATVLSVEGRGFMAGVNPVDRIINTATSQNVIFRSAVNGTAKLKEITKLTVVPTAKDHGYGLRLFGIDAYGAVNEIVSGVEAVAAEMGGMVDVYTLQGVKVRAGVEAAEALEGLPNGLYIVGGKKVVK